MNPDSLLDTKYKALEDFTQRLLASDVKDQIAKMSKEQAQDAIQLAKTLMKALEGQIELPD